MTRVEPEAPDLDSAEPTPALRTAGKPHIGHPSDDLHRKYSRNVDILRGFHAPRFAPVPAVRPTRAGRAATVRAWTTRRVGPRREEGLRLKPVRFPAARALLRGIACKSLVEPATNSQHASRRRSGDSLPQPKTSDPTLYSLQSSCNASRPYFHGLDHNSGKC